MCTLMSVLRGPGHLQTSRQLGSVRLSSAPAGVNIFGTYLANVG